MFHLFEAPGADGLWHKLAESFQAGCFTPDQHGRGGLTSEMLHACMCIHNPRQRWTSSRIPALNVAFALAETVWILRGRNDSAFLNFFNRELPKYAGDGPFYHGAYGYRLRHGFRRDQLEAAYLALKSNPESRQIVLQIWDPALDLPSDKGIPVARDIPCNVSSLVKIRSGKLEWLQFLRSNDLFRGFPYNLVQFTTLQEVFSGWLGVELGAYHQVSDSLHVYEDTASFVKGSAPFPAPDNLDNLAVPKPASDQAFEALESIVEDLMTGARSPEETAKSWFDSPTPQAHKNIGLVLCAEAARRAGKPRSAEAVILKCNNALLVYLFTAWLGRMNQKTVS